MQLVTQTTSVIYQSPYIMNGVRFSHHSFQSLVTHYHGAGRKNSILFSDIPEM